MAYEQRRLLNNLSGTLAARAVASDTQITCQGGAPGISNVFAALPTDLSSALYTPLVLANDATGKFEVVWAVGHATASPTLTVIRGREGTDAQTFEVGDVVRCSGTVRDFGITVANRAALPGDAHIGMKAFVISDNVCVERTAFGWSDTTLADEPARKHRWNQSGVGVTAPGGLVSGLSGGQLNASGKYATMSNGALLLNQPGDWVVGLCMYGTSQTARNQGVEMRWPDGAFPGGIGSLFDVGGVQGGSSPVGNGLNMVMWEGYVPPAAAAKPISMYTSSTVTLVGAVFDVFAEYKGR